MQLYLSSYKIGKQKQILVEMIGKRKIALIPNSIDIKSDDPNVNPRTRLISLNDDIKELESLGIEVEVLDLRKYFGKKEELEAKLNEFGGVYVRGGNSFLLRKAFNESGFDEILKVKLSDTEFVYAGYSAGVVVLSDTLKGIDIVDDPNIKVEGYKDGIIWEGLGIIKYSVAPHYDPNWRTNEKRHPESEKIEETVQYFEANGIKYVAMRDGEVIVRDNSGKETFYRLEGNNTGPEK